VRLEANPKVPTGYSDTVVRRNLHESLYDLAMPKSKKNDRPRRRRDPTIGRSPKPVADAKTAALRDEKILPVIAALASSEPKKRSEAAMAIANLIDDQRCRELLLKEQLVRVIMEQIITDSNLEVMAAGWGVLRNLVLEEGDDLRIHLFRLDILTPVEAVTRYVCSPHSDSVYVCIVRRLIDVVRL